MEQSKFMVVTNDSAGEIDMSFGWKICMLNGDIKTKHSGPAFGQVSSFHAEGYGVLSALSFFCRAMEYTETITKLAFKNVSRQQRSHYKN
eukprot:10412403-Ditylum_brightwellii.AAC.1